MGTQGPIEETYKAQMTALARVIDEFLNGDVTKSERKTGFCILMFPFGDREESRINYISNAERKDMLTAMKELIARFEGRHPEEQPGYKKVKQ